MNRSSLNKLLLASAVAFFSSLSVAEEPQAEGPTQEGYDDSHRDEYVTAKLGGQLQAMSFFGTGGINKKTTQQQSVYFLTNGNIDVNASGITRDGLNYGGTVSLSSDYASVEQMQSSVLSAYIDVSGAFGTVKFGSLSSSAAGELAIDGASSTLGGQEGFAGYLGSVYSGCIGAITSQYMAYEIQGGSSILYSTPDLMGFTLAVSYTPHNKMVGSKSKADTKGTTWDNTVATPVSNNLYPTVKNMFAGGVQYNYAVDDWHATASVVGWKSQSALWSDDNDPANTVGLGNKVNSLKAYQIGAILGYQDWTVGIGFMDMKNSLLNRNLSETNGLLSGADAGKAYTAGTSYVLGKWKFAIACMHTVAGFGGSSKAKCNAWSGTVDFNYVEGLAIYAEADFIETKTCQQALRYNFITDPARLNTEKYKSTGQFFVIGTRLSF